MLGRIIRRLQTDRRGSVAIELAFYAIPLFITILGGIEFGFMIFAESRVGGVLQQAARMAMTGDRDANGANGENIDAMVIRQLTMTKSTRVEIDKSYYDKFSQVRKPENKDSAGTTPPYCWTDVNGNQIWDKDSSRTGLGGANDIINYKVTVKYTPLFPIITNFVTRNRLIELTGQATLQNEPFEGGQDQVEKKCCISAAAGNPVTCTEI